ncbi:MAG TPA: hypothetical protein VGM23_01835, partial [Armatimonadota bacterium]
MGNTSRLSLLIGLLLLWSAVAWCGVNVWIGKNSADWGVPQNWSNGAVPTEKDGEDLRIPGGIATYPVLSKDTVLSGTVTIEAGATLTLAGHRLTVVNQGLLNKGTLDASGAGSIIALKSGGFINDGTVVGEPALLIPAGTTSRQLKSGAAKFSAFTLATGTYTQAITLNDNLTVTGDVNFKAGTVLFGDNTLTVSGSCTLPPFSDKPFDTVVLRSTAKAKIIFTSDRPAFID